MLPKILKQLNFPRNAIEAYMQLLEKGPSTARQLAIHLSIPRPSIYGYLNFLLQKGLIIENDKEGKKMFSVDDARALEQLVHEQSESLKKSEAELAAILPSMIRETTTIEPKIKIYSGADGVKKVLNELLWCKNIETYTMWPISNMVGILGKDYLEHLNRVRIKNRVSIKGLWPHNKKVRLKEYPFLGVGSGHLRELRTTPKEVTWDMSYWIYGDKVAFISSKRELFGFVVHSRDFVELLKTQFKVIWKLSKPIKAESRYTDEFLKTI